MSDTKNKINAGIDDAATKTKQVSEKVGETTMLIAGEKNDSMSDAKQHGTDAIHECENSSKNAVDAVTDKSSDLKSGACAFAEQTTEKAKEGYRLIAKQTHQGITRAGAIVRANPASTLTVAFAVGIGVGLILVRTPRRKRDWWSFAR